MSKVLLEVKDLKKYFDVKEEQLRAIDGVSFTINEGETMGLVGESGCGKSTVGNVLIQLLQATSGSVLFNGKDIFQVKGEERKVLCRDIQIIFQDPYSSLNPKKTIRKILSEAYQVQKIYPRKEIRKHVEELCKDVNLPLDILSKYPHELDGGKRQTVGIARALSLNPKIIICDEPVSSLDVSIQAQIINILMDLREKKNLTYLFISHDLSVVKHISTNIKVMYLGKIMEESLSEDLFENPLHPYTKALLSAVPSIESTSDKKRIILEGDVPSPINPPPGCRFCKRCWIAQEVCFKEEPKLEETGQLEHRVACHFADKGG